MAERRMFSKTIIDSDLFLDMSLSTQSLYFHLSMRADDDGFVNNPKKIQRMIGAGDDEMKILIAKSFILPFESGICVIKHWRIHNFIRTDRYKRTLYTDELEQLEIGNSKAYEIKKHGIPNDNQEVTDGTPMVDEGDTQVRLDQERLGQARKDSSSSCETIEEEDGLKEIMFLCQRSDYKLRKVDANKFIESYGIEKVKAAIVTATSTAAFEQGKIKSYKSYLASILNDISKDKKVDITITKESKKDNFNNFKQRELDVKDIEENVLGWH